MKVKRTVAQQCGRRALNCLESSYMAHAHALERTLATPQTS